jgi:type 1 glutamine amidotransferase
MTRKLLAIGAVAWIVLAEIPAGQACARGARVLFVCHSISHIHASVVPAERALRKLGERNGFELECFRYTHDPAERATVETRIYGRPTAAGQPLLPQYSAAFEAVTGEPILPRHCGRLDADTLARYDAVIFFTKDDPCGTDDERRALLDFVRSGHGFVGVHSATVTHFDWPEYGQMLGGYFDRIVLHAAEVPLVVAAGEHEATGKLPPRFALEHEVYQFRAPYDTSAVEVLLRVDPAYVARLQKGFRPKSIGIEDLGGLRADGDLAVSWCRREGRGRVFYTALGHPSQQWEDERFLDHVLGGLQWAMGAQP